MKNYQFKTPESVNFTKETIKAVKELLFFPKWQFWVIVVIFVVLGVISGGVIPVFLLAGCVIYVNSKIRKHFWKDFADINGWEYIENGNFELESGVMFTQGDNRSISNVVSGLIDDRQFRIFNYNFTVGSGKSKITYDYIVFAFKFDGSFPHVYLNSKEGYFYELENGISVGETIPLPSEFEKKFTLMAPRKYEIEALEIFTPDVLVKLLDNGFSHDVEFVNSEVLIFTSGLINNAEKLEKEFKMALEIEDLLDEKLDKFKFEKIGDMPHTL